MKSFRAVTHLEKLEKSGNLTLVGEKWGKVEKVMEIVVYYRSCSCHKIYIC